MLIYHFLLTMSDSTPVQYSMSLCGVNQSEEEDVTQSFVMIILFYFACGALSVQTLLFWHWYPEHNQDLNVVKVQMFTLHQNALASSATTASSFKSRFFFFFFRSCFSLKLVAAACVWLCSVGLLLSIVVHWCEAHWVHLCSNMCYANKSDITSLKSGYRKIRITIGVV